MRTPRLPIVDWTDAPADLNGFVRFAERRNLVSARVPSYFNWHLRRAVASLFLVSSTFYWRRTMWKPHCCTSGHGRRHCPSKYRKCRIGQTRNWFLTPGPVTRYRVHLSWVSSLRLLPVHMCQHLNGTTSPRKSSNCIFGLTVHPISLYFHFLAGTGLHQFCLRHVSIHNRIRLFTYLLTYLLTYSMVQSLSWEANWFAASQEIPRISRNPKVHYRTHKRPPTICILGPPNQVHIPTSHLLEIHPNIIHPSTPRPPQ